jgi:uncharacterized protein (TIGR02246 family)
MKRTLAALLVLCGSVLVVAQTPAPAAASSSRDIDRDVWQVIIETVEQDDIVRMGSTYTADAVIVTPTGTQPIAAALERWGRDMVANKAKGTKATVAFRFARRSDNETTAFETGIFNYTTITKDGVRTPGYYPFEQLLVKTGGRWRIVMERQFAAVTEAEWNKLR